jgi:hypothetical protein
MATISTTRRVSDSPVIVIPLERGGRPAGPAVVAAPGFEAADALRALGAMRRRRWMHVRRHGRPGARWYTIEPRSRAQRASAPIVVIGPSGALALDHLADLPGS